MNNRKYEAMYIVKPSLSDAEVGKIADRFKSLIEEKGGTVAEAGKWDKRRLTYDIQGFREGTYILMLFEAAGAVPQELSRLLGIHDDVIRHRVFKIEG